MLLSCQLSTSSRQRSTSHSNKVANKTKYHIGSSSPTTLGVVELQLEDVFLIIFILNIDRKPKVVEIFILGPSMARLALSRVARQRMVGSAITTTTSESRTDWCKETCTGTSERESQLLSSSPESRQIFLLVSNSFASRQWQLP